MKTVFLTLILAVNFAFTSYTDDSAMLVEVIPHKENVVALHYQMSEERAVKIKIINAETQEVVFTEMQSHHKVAVIKYDLSHLPVGRYIIEVKQGSNAVSKMVWVK